MVSWSTWRVVGGRLLHSLHRIDFCWDLLWNLVYFSFFGGRQPNGWCVIFCSICQSLSATVCSSSDLGGGMAYRNEDSSNSGLRLWVYVVVWGDFQGESLPVYRTWVVYCTTRWSDSTTPRWLYFILSTRSALCIGCSTVQRANPSHRQGKSISVIHKSGFEFSITLTVPFGFQLCCCSVVESSILISGSVGVLPCGIETEKDLFWRKPMTVWRKVWCSVLLLLGSWIKACY